jgi:ABC-type phosphate/phosphonate transport system substrate-binding protein
MKSIRKLGILVVVLVSVLFASAGYGADLRIAITHTQAMEARKYQPLLDYLAKHGFKGTFVTAKDYPAAAEMFDKGQVDAMFSGSAVAAAMIIREVADPLVRPIKANGYSTYSGIVVAPKGSPRFTGSGSYFDGKRVACASFASAGEIYFRSLGATKPKQLMVTPNHNAALDAVGRGQADVGIVKNHVWTADKGKYPNLELVGESRIENPDGTLIVSRRMSAAAAQKIAAALLAIKDDASAEGSAAKKALNIREFIKTTNADFKGTIDMLKKAGITKDSKFSF